MPSTRRLQQLNATNGQLKQIQVVIEAAKDELRQLQVDIKATRHEHTFTVAKLKKIRIQRRREMRKELEGLSKQLQSDIILLQKTVEGYTAEKGLIEYEIGELGRKLERQKQEYEQASKDDVEKLAKLKDSVEKTTETLAAHTAELEEIDGQLEHSNRRREHFEKLLVRAEEAYTVRSDELRKQVRDVEDKLARTERFIQEYEVAAIAIREADKSSAADLARREAELVAGKRALVQNRIDFDAEKKRFYQTKSL